MLDGMQFIGLANNGWIFSMMRRTGLLKGEAQIETFQIFLYIKMRGILKIIRLKNGFQRSHYLPTSPIKTH